MAPKQSLTQAKSASRKRLVVVLSYDFSLRQHRQAITFSSTDSSTTSNASLLGLPPSIRSRIYEMCFGIHDIPQLYGNRDKILSTAPGILLTCKQVYGEGIDQYYSSSIFRFAYREHVVKWLGRIPAQRRKMITNVTMMIIKGSPYHHQPTPAQLAACIERDFQDANLALAPGVVRGMIGDYGRNRKEAMNHFVVRADSSGSILLSLPAEIRTRIVEYVLGTAHKIKYRTGKHRLPKAPGILLTYRQVYTESLPLYYRSLAFEDTQVAFDYLTSVPRERLSWIRHLYYHRLPRPAGDAEDAALELEEYGSRLSWHLSRARIYFPPGVVKARCSIPGNVGSGQIILPETIQRATRRGRRLRELGSEWH